MTEKEKAGAAKEKGPMRFAIGVAGPQAALIRSARDKLLGPAFAGTRENGGIHGPMPESWDGEGQVPPGWTGWPGVLPDGPLFKVSVPAEIDLLPKGTLTVPEQLALTAMATTELLPSGNPIPVGGNL